MRTMAGSRAESFVRKLEQRSATGLAKVEKQVRRIVDDVRRNGDRALRRPGRQAPAEGRRRGHLGHGTGGFPVVGAGTRGRAGARRPGWDHDRPRLPPWLGRSGHGRACGGRGLVAHGSRHLGQPGGPVRVAPARAEAG